LFHKADRSLNNKTGQLDLLTTRPHSALEIAQAFEVSSQVIAGILGAAQRRLAGIGLTAVQIREAARWEAELQHQPGARPLPESKKKSWSGHRANG
jgi:hypothetical protein